MDRITVDISGLSPDNGTNALLNYEVRFSKPVNADWLWDTIQSALDKDFYAEKDLMVECFECGDHCTENEHMIGYNTVCFQCYIERDVV